jgi:hypothetical protein|tara:strand:- start:128 stop:241 length:114 start_codon:yes stop_codon:yes gene_type:complete
MAFAVSIFRGLLMVFLTHEIDYNPMVFRLIFNWNKAK